MHTNGESPKYVAFHVRKLPVCLRQDLKVMAAKRGVTMEKLVVELLTKAVKEGK